MAPAKTIRRLARFIAGKGLSGAHGDLALTVCSNDVGTVTNDYNCRVAGWIKRSRAS
jgi:hypothetical protein